MNGKDNNNNNNDNQSPYKKPPLIIQIFLWGYGLFWLQSIFAAGLNSLYIGRIDYDGWSMAGALTAGLYAIFKYLPRMLK